MTGRVALGGFGQIYTGTQNGATNTRVQLRNLETYVLAAGTWKRVQYSEKVKGAYFPAHYSSPGTATTLTNYRVESSGGVSIKPEANRMFRFWPESGLTRSLVPIPSAVQAVFTTVQARLIRDSESIPADFASAKLLVNTAAEWRNQTDFEQLYLTDVPPPDKLVGNDQIGNGRLRLVETEWQAFNFHSATSASQIDLLAAASPGTSSSLANSSSRELAPAKKVVVIGDSISQGNSGHDSFRRNLWNRIVSDPINPLVDLLGSRKGVLSAGGSGTCGSSLPDDDGLPKLPEFDQDHEAYWGWCIDDVRRELQTIRAGWAAADIALVHLGTNDLLQLLPPANGASQAWARLKLLIADLQQANPRMRIFVATLIPVSGAASTEALAFNNLVRVEAAARSTASSIVSVVDQASALTAADLYDGIHPNDAGEEKIAMRWWDPTLRDAVR